MAISRIKEYVLFKNKVGLILNQFEFHIGQTVFGDIYAKVFS